MCLNSVLFAYQKFYSAIKNITDVNNNTSFLNMISHFDSFFSEMRSITFAIQKNIGPEKLHIYKELRDKYLIGDEDFSWLVDMRDRTIHEGPLQIEKEIELTIYDGVDLSKVQKSFYIKLFYDIDIDEVVNKYLISLNAKIEIYFTQEIVFHIIREKGNLLMKIYDLIYKMNVFLFDIKDKIGSNDKIDYIVTEVSEKIIRLKYRDFYYIDDFIYTVEDSTINSFDKAEGFTCDLNGSYKKFGDHLIPLEDNPLYKNCKNVDELFVAFLNLNLRMYEMSGFGDYMPTAMTVNLDNTFRLYMVPPTSKTRIYRMSHDIAKRILIDNTVTLMYCGVMLAFDGNEKAYIMTSLERAKLQSREMMYFCLYSKKYNRYKQMAFLKEDLVKKVFEPMDVSGNKSLYPIIKQIEKFTNSI